MRDAVYHSLPFAFRRKGHLALAHLLDVDADVKPKLWPTLANHYEQGGDQDQARKYHRLAGRDAFARYDNVTALRHLEFVCKAITADEQDIEDAFSLMDIFGNLGKWGEAAGTLSKTDELEEKITLAQRARLHNYLAQDAAAKQDWEKAENLLRRGIALAEMAGDLVLQGKAYVNLVGRVYGPTGRLEEARECLEKALALPKGPNQEVFRVLAAMNLGAVNKHAGRMEQAQEWSRKAHRMSSRWRLDSLRGMIAINLGSLCYERGDFIHGCTWNRKAIQILETFAMRGFLLLARQSLAVSLQALGKAEEARTLLNIVARQSLSQGHQQALHCAQQGLAHEAYLEGDINAFLDLSTRAMSAFRCAEDRWVYLCTVGDVIDAFLALESQDQANQFWRLNDIGPFLEPCGHNQELEAPFTRIKNWAAKGTLPHKRVQKNRVGGGRNPAREQIEHYSWATISALQKGNLDSARETLSLAKEALRQWPFLVAKLRCLFLDYSLNPERSERRDRMAKVLLSKCLGGIWGARLALVIARSTSAKVASLRWKQDAILRLYTIKDHSPDWVWERLSSLPEVRAVFEQEQGTL